MINNSPNITVNNLYQNFKSPALENNKAYLLNTYGEKKVLYYNDEAKTKNKKISKFLIVGAVAFTLAGAAITAFASMKSPVFSRLLKNTMKSAEDTINKDGKKIIDVLKALSLNFTNLKDTAYKKLTNLSDFLPVKKLRDFNDLITSGAKNISKASIKPKFEAIVEEMKKNGYNGPELDFAKIYKNADDTIISTLEKDPVQFNKLLEGDKSNKIFNLFTNITKPVIDNKIAGNLQQFLVNVPEGATPELEKSINKLNTLMTDSMFAKLRDYNCGSVPTDLITSGVPLAAFGIALAKTDDKEERKSFKINLGIPLVPTLLMPFVGYYFPVLNGLKGMMAGFAAGQSFKYAAKFIDNRIAQKNDTNKKQSDIQ